MDPLFEVRSVPSGTPKATKIVDNICFELKVSPVSSIVCGIQKIHFYIREDILFVSLVIVDCGSKTIAISKRLKKPVHGILKDSLSFKSCIKISVPA